MSYRLTKIGRWLRRNWPLILLVIIFATAYSLYALLRHHHFGSGGYDLGIFDQAIWHYSRFQSPASTIRGVKSLLGDHFSPILILLVPLYWAYDSPGALLVAQGCLLALAMVPIWLFAKERIGKLPAYALVMSYGIFWGVQSTASYDFHEVAFAVPLIAFAIYFIDRQWWRGYFATIALLLLVKEDLAILVAFFGLYLILHRYYRPGLATALLGIGWFFLATKVFIPFFAGPGIGYIYWSYAQLGATPLAAVRTVLLHPRTTLHIFFNPAAKSQTLKLIFGWFLYIPLASSLMVLMIPLLAERFLSTNATFWVPLFHYTATISPILAMATADGLHNLTWMIKKDHLRYGLFLGFSLAILFVNAYRHLESSPLWSLTDRDFYQTTAYDTAGYRALSLVPPNASVVAQDGILSHLTHRQKAYELSSASPLADYVLASQQMTSWPNDNYQKIDQLLKSDETKGYKVIYAVGGWTVLKRQ